MAGATAGSRGPIPKRSGTRLGNISNGEAEGAHVTKAKAAEDVQVPRVVSDWHPIAKRWFKALKDSGQSEFYEPSDWAYAYFLADQMSYYQKSKSRSSMMLTAILSGMTGLLLTEGDRRRARIELVRGSPEEEKSAAVIAIEAYKNQLRQVPSGESVGSD